MTPLAGVTIEAIMYEGVAPMNTKAIAATRNGNRRQALRLLALAGLAITFITFAATQPRPQTRVGLLECNISGGIGFVVTSRKALSCAYRGFPAGSNATPVRSGNLAWISASLARPKWFGLYLQQANPARAR